MRILVDLGGPRGGDAGGERDLLTLRLVHAICAAPGDHEVWVVVDDSVSGVIPALRRALDGLVPRDRIVLYSLPAAGDPSHPESAWRGRAASEVRRAFLEGLRPDVVQFASPARALPPSPERFVSSALVSMDDALGLEQSSSGRPDVMLALSDEARRIALQATGADEDLVAIVQAIEDSGTWGAAAAAALEAFERACARPGCADPPEMEARPRLAFVSPLPPERSGIADYSAELLPELARHYDIDVVLEQDRLDDPWVRANLPRRSVEWFEAHAHEFDTVVYQIGNSQFHQHMFALLRRHPGVVVLHELFLSGGIQYCESALGRRWVFLRALYASHGYGALVDDAERGREAAAWTYPCSRQVIDSSDGVIVHSQFIMRLADEWFGEGASSDWRIVPLCRASPEGVIERSGARQRLGLSDEDFLVCAFGILGPTKLNDRLLDAWLGSSLARDPGCRLAFVGGAPPGPYLDALVRRLEVEDPARRVRITGFVSREDYEEYLVAADLSVQLRAETRGETSAAVLDCVAHGLPTLVNAHGWATELPRDAVAMVPEDASGGSIAAAIERLRSAPDERRALSERAAEYVATEHDPVRAAELYRDAIEHFAECSPGGVYRRLLRSLGRIETVRSPERSDLIEVAKSIAANRPRRGSKQLLVDVTELARLDLKTGIQRVTRAVLLALVRAPPPGYRVEAVREEGGRYVYARRYTLGLLGFDEPFLDDEPIEGASGDVFLGLDLAYGPIQLAEQQLVALRDRGVRVAFVVYDLLPVLRADWFPDPIPKVHLEWLRRITGFADGVVCISRTVAEELITWLGAEGPARETPLDVGFFHMGADLTESRPTTGLAPDAGVLLAGVRSRPTFLMVGTVEPRKGHDQALAAFEQLWQRGVDVGLVVVGKEGWVDGTVMARLRTHPERGKKLTWLGDASDETLSRLYESSAALLAASEGEGFGLPLIEAAQHGLPALARDIPVFREVAGEHATYFSGSLPENLSQAIVDWLALKDRDGVPCARDLPWLTWAQSAEQLAECVLGEKWLSAWLQKAGE